VSFGRVFVGSGDALSERNEVRHADPSNRSPISKSNALPPMITVIDVSKAG